MRDSDGMLYFMQGSSLERFGFPRIDRKKKYCWKKMNFITNLPKRQPQVKYIVAPDFYRLFMHLHNHHHFPK